MEKRKSYCMVCGKERDGVPIKNDYIIEAIRWFKTNVTKDVKNNRIVVCKECYPKYVKQRKRYESRQRLFIVLGVLFLVFGLIISLSITTVVYSLLVIALLYLISLLLYTPDLEVSRKRKSAA